MDGSCPSAVAEVPSVSTPHARRLLVEDWHSLPANLPTTPLPPIRRSPRPRSYYHGSRAHARVVMDRWNDLRLRPVH